MARMASKSVADIEGAWVESDFDSGLIERCKRYWKTPANELPDVMVATYLSQRMAMTLMIDEARRRVAIGHFDDTELYDGQLCETLARAVSATGH